MGVLLPNVAIAALNRRELLRITVLPLCLFAVGVRAIRELLLRLRLLAVQLLCLAAIARFLCLFAVAALPLIATLLLYLLAVATWAMRKGSVEAGDQRSRLCLLDHANGLLLVRVGVVGSNFVDSWPLRSKV